MLSLTLCLVDRPPGRFLGAGVYGPRRPGRYQEEGLRGRPQCGRRQRGPPVEGGSPGLREAQSNRAR